MRAALLDAVSEDDLREYRLRASFQSQGRRHGRGPRVTGPLPGQIHGGRFYRLASRRTALGSLPLAEYQRRLRAIAQRGDVQPKADS